MSQGRRTGWSEDESALYRHLAGIAVPDREEQLTALISQVPFRPNDNFFIVELACGDGSLATAMLEVFPKATMLAMDGSPNMLGAARGRLTGFGRRAEAAPFDLGSDDWLDRVSGAGCVVSSLAVHHLPDPAKRGLFESVFERLSPDGALLIADVIAGSTPQAWHLHADLYDMIAVEQSLSTTGSRDLFMRLEQERWNVFRYPDPSDMPATVADQLIWLSDAGFQDVDCWWLKAGHAVFGGYKTAWSGESHGVPRNGPSYENALAAVWGALAD